MPSLKYHMERSLWNYPILYEEDQYTYWRLLRSLFSSSEYVWNDNGELEIDGSLPQEDKIPPEEHERKLKYARSAWHISAQVNEMLGIEKPPIRITFHQTEFHAIQNVPDNVTDEYLLAALSYLEVIATAPLGWFYNRPAKVKGQYSFIPEEQKALATEFLASLKDRFANRLQEA